MANTPHIIWVNGVPVRVRFARPFATTIPVQFCWAWQARIDHSCDEMGCWPEVDQ